MKQKTTKKTVRKTKLKVGRRLGIYIDGETSEKFAAFCKDWEVPNTSTEVCAALNDWMGYHGRP